MFIPSTVPLSSLGKAEVSRAKPVETTMAPPAPWSALKRRRKGREGEAAERRLERERRRSPSTKSLLLPLRSASLPKGRRRAAELRRKEVLTHPRRTVSA